MNQISFDGTFAGWKRAARQALADGSDPSHTRWINERSAQTELGFASPVLVLQETPGSFRVPREFMTLAGDVSCHRDDTRWELLYRALWRITHGEPHLLDVAVDPDVSQLAGMAKAVARDIHKMHAFVRFREVTIESDVWFVAWFEPQHHIVEAAVSFFRDRFAAMRWSILTPDVCAHWDLKVLHFTPGVSADAAPQTDAMEGLWRTYYSSIFNPARLKIGAMTSEMPRHYWKNLPEAKAIPSLIAAAEARVGRMVESSHVKRAGADDFFPAPVPATRDLLSLRDAAATCRACPLWRTATCTVFGEGPERARIVVVGEQPGDQEDRAGRPFVGPAGQLFNRALTGAELDRELFYVTNAVKHFKWEPRGKRRLHQKPNSREIAACRPWLEAEIRSIAPDLIVCLGGTAAQSVLGRPVRVLAERGQRFPTEFGVPALITVHPSSLLRLPDGPDTDTAFAQLVDDLRKIRV